MEATDIYGYLRAHASELGSRILESYPPLQSMTDEVPAELSTLLRAPLPAQAIAIGGLAKYLKSARAARIVAECGAGKTYMALGLAHILKARTILVMCPSHLGKKWAREAIQTIPFVRTFLIEDMRNGGDPRQPHGVLEVRLRKGRVVYEGMQLSLADLRGLGHAGWMQRVPRCSVFIIPKDKGKLSYFWRHALLTAKCGPELGGVINPDTGVSIENPDGGRRCQVYATYTGEKDVNGRLEQVLSAAGLRVAVLRASVPTQKREEWYDRQLESGVEVVVCHPKLVETGLDLLAFPTLYFYQTGYSLHTLRQASRRSWRIGQRHPVRVKFLTYKGTMQEICLRLMGRKMLVALMMEGKFSGEGLQSLDADEDLMAAMARELVEKAGVGESADQIWRLYRSRYNRHYSESETMPSKPLLPSSRQLKQM